MISIQLHPTLPVLTPKGKGYAIIMMDYGQEHDLLWVCVLDDSGEIWTYRNQEVRVQKNLTFSRKQTSEIKS